MPPPVEMEWIKKEYGTGYSSAKRGCLRVTSDPNGSYAVFYTDDLGDLSPDRFGCPDYGYEVVAVRRGECEILPDQNPQIKLKWVMTAPQDVVEAKIRRVALKDIVAGFPAAIRYHEARGNPDAADRQRKRLTEFKKLLADA